MDLIRNQQDPAPAAKQLVDHALARFSTDNLSCMVVRFDKSALLTTAKEPASAIGVEGDPLCLPGKISEVEKIVGDAKRKVAEDGVPGVGVSGSNSGKGHDPKAIDEEPIVNTSPSKSLGFSFMVHGHVFWQDPLFRPCNPSKNKC